VNRRSVRTSRDDITVFLNSSVASHNVALGAWVYREALQKGIRLQWDLDVRS
jgi:ornithine cyclodeaminase/alanine dehydrogenase-like protein (mu-crystallin family)